MHRVTWAVSKIQRICMLCDWCLPIRLLLICSWLWWLCSSYETSEYKYSPNQPFQDPAIMSARLASPVLSSAMPSNAGSANATPSITESYTSSHSAFGPPSGFGLPSAISFISQQSSNIPPKPGSPISNADVSRQNMPSHGESFNFLFEGRMVSVPSPVLSQCGSHVIGLD